MDALRETRPAEGVFVWTLGGETIATSYGANCTAIAGRDATLLVDPLIAPSHARLVEEAAARARLPPVRWVVLTHHHTDHALGSSWLARRGATVVAHAECGSAMATAHPGIIAERRRTPELSDLFADAESRPPGLTFTESVSIDLGGIEAMVRHPGHGHTRGDAVVHVAARSLAVCGDLVSNRYHVNFEDASPDGFEAGLEKLLALDAAAYVPGHGAPGGREVVERQVSYVRKIRRIVAERRGSGCDPEEVAAAIASASPGFLLEIVLTDTVRRFSESPDPDLVGRRPPPTV
jgi:glyoxylase-like metal-dependent hydrolase (beta-lactamase superfamily II)